MRIKDIIIVHACPSPSSAMQVEEQICAVFDAILSDILAGKSPTLTVVEVGSKSRTLSPKTPKTIRPFSIGDLKAIASSKSLAVHVRLLVYILSLIRGERRVTKREAFYQFESLFKTQASLDDALDRLARTLRVPRRELRIDAAGKGLYFGSLELRGDDANEGSGQAHPIPTDSITIEKAEGFVLVVEKEAVFQTILDDHAHLRSALGPFIVITGKGYPCMATRRLVALLGERHKLPVFVLVDYDPYGFEIALQYRIGSKKLPDDIDDLKCPSLRFLGISRSDLDAHSTHFDTFPVPDAERKRIQKLKASFQALGCPNVVKELAFMLDHDVKAEIESVKKTGDPHYFTRTFLVDKIRQQNLS
jgi:meiotic recombination protein SPO11